MNEQAIKNSAEPERTADWYVARLFSGEVSAKEEAEFFAWVQSSDSHRREYERALRVWDAAGELADHEQIMEMRLAARSRKRRRRMRRWTSVGIAATIVLGVSLLTTLGPVVTEDIGSPQRFETAIGESRTVTLADGSSMVMNTATRVIVDFTPDARRLILDFGEIYLDVEKDPERPLSVVAGNRVVTAIGTGFSVSKVGNTLEVAVVEGTVAVTKQGVIPPAAIPTAESHSNDTTANGSVILHGGAVAEFEGDQPSIIAENNLLEVKSAQSWLDGVVIFESEPLILVIGELNRYSPVKVLIEDSAITEFPVTAVLEVDDIELFLSSLEAIHPVQVTRHADRYVVVGR